MSVQYADAEESRVNDLDLRRDARGHYKGCLFAGCVGTRCREAAMLHGLPGDVTWRWVTRRGDEVLKWAGGL